MSGRPSARFHPPPRPPLKPAPQPLPPLPAEPKPCRRALLAAARVKVLRLLEGPRRDVYSVDVAAELGWSVGRAVWLLKSMQSDGVLVSVKRMSPLSGQGRRYYRRAVAEVKHASN
jgi:hypothetical protein